jgi:glycosyltransferase 2 family protein
MTRRTWKQFAGELTFAIGLGAIVWLVVRLGWQSIARALAFIGPGGVLILALAHIPTLVVLGCGWWAVARKASSAAPPTFVWARLLREAGSELLPFSQVGGFALGIRALALSGTSWVAATASSLLDAFAEQAAKTPYTLIGVALLLRLSHRGAVIGPALILVGITTAIVGFVVLKRDWVRARLEALAETLSRKSLGRSAPGPSGAGETVRRALAPGGGLGLSLGLHFAGWCLGGAETWLAFTLLGAHLTLLQALVIDSLFTAVKVFAFSIPGAVGVQEAAYVVLAGLFAVPAPIAVAFSLVRRGRDLVLGGPALLIWQLCERTRRGAKAPADAR